MEIPESQKASPCNAMNIDKRKLWIGFICSLLYILLKIMSGLDEYEMALDKTYHTAKQLIFVITNCYLFISILFLLKNVLVDYYHQEKLRTNLVWIIKLNAIIAALSILFVLGLGRYLAAIMVILAIISLIFYLRFFGDIMSMDEFLITKPDASFLLKVSGDSMIGEGIMEGDLVIVERGRTPMIGDVVIAEVDGEWTMKYFKKENGKVYLEAANPKYPIIRPRTDLQLGGVVTGVIRKYH